MCGTVIHCAQRTVQYLHLSKMLSAIPNFSLYIFERAGFEPVGGNRSSPECTAPAPHTEIEADTQPGGESPRKADIYELKYFVLCVQHWTGGRGYSGSYCQPA